MHRQLLFIFFLFHVLVGLLIVVFNGPFYGDAQNFYGYAEEIRASNNFFEFLDISSTFNYNVYFVSMLYSSPFQSVVVNFLSLLFFLRIIFSRINLLGKKFFVSNLVKANLYYFSFFIILCPSTIVRFGEPSREYLLSLLLFLVGFSFYANRAKLLFLSALSIAIMIRPVSAPLYILWISFIWISSKANTTKIFSTILFFILIIVLPELPIVQLYNDKLIDYDGVLLDSGNYVYKLIFNLFGDVNSFLTDRYPVFYRFVFFLNYVWRLIFIWFLLSRYKMLALFFILFTSLLIAVVYPFPHPRYFEPSLFFFAGIVCGRSVFLPFGVAVPGFPSLTGRSC